MSDKNDQLTIQQKMQQLEDMVAWFQGDEFNLDEALDRHAAVEKLADEIETDLTELKNDIQVIDKRFE